MVELTDLPLTPGIKSLTGTQHCPQRPLLSHHQLSVEGPLQALSLSRGGGLTTPTPAEVFPLCKQIRLQGICRRSSSLNESRLGSSLPLLLPPFLSFLSRKTCCQAQVWWQLQGEETFGPGQELCRPYLLGQLGSHNCVSPATCRDTPEPLPLASACQWGGGEQSSCIRFGQTRWIPFGSEDENDTRRSQCQVFSSKEGEWS